MEIKRINKIFSPEGSLWWSKTHAMMPVPDLLEDRIRIYFSSLDGTNTGRIGFIEVERDNPTSVITVSQHPVLDIGTDGHFDDNGLVPSCVLNYNGKKYLYYYGFQLLKKARFFLFTGVAVSDDNGNSFKKLSQTPLLDRNETDPFVRSLAFVREENNRYRVWYNGVNEWTTINGKKLPFGHIRHMEAASPINFNGSKITTCLSPESDEFSLSRPFVFRKNNSYQMLISCRLRATDSYRLGYAESADGLLWQRRKNILSISPSHQEWDSSEMCYTSLLEVDNKTLLFYNGNGFGATGFGYAEINT